jgi:hypothetical protein
VVSVFERAARSPCVVACRQYSAGRCDYYNVQSMGDYVKAVFGDGGYCLRRYRPNWFIRGVPLLKRQLSYKGM